MEPFSLSSLERKIADARERERERERERIQREQNVALPCSKRDAQRTRNEEKRALTTTTRARNTG
jgi:hypothetical protein